ncbi:MAG: hypothetical protein HC906_04750 [Bacteroidales bacterium]|nr:hypothetical protein [Bacteroidales bacterium]
MNDIIDIAQIESGQLSISESEFDLMTLMNEVRDIYKLNKSVLKKQLEIELNLPQNQSIKIISDQARLKQVIFNLMNNAVKFTDSGN